jgi:hypothetical protein
MGWKIRCDGESCKVLEFWMQLNRAMAYHLHLATYSPDLKWPNSAASHGGELSRLPCQRHYISKGNHHSSIASKQNARATMLHLVTNAVARQKRRQAMTIRQASSCHGRKPGGMRRGRWGLRVRGRWSSAPRAPPVPAQCRHGRRRPEWDESSFYAEAIADCLEFIKSRSSYCPVNGGRV